MPNLMSERFLKKFAGNPKDRPGRTLENDESEEKVDHDDNILNQQADEDPVVKQEENAVPGEKKRKV